MGRGLHVLYAIREGEGFHKTKVETCSLFFVQEDE
jgi:hypothetical protein